MVEDKPTKTRSPNQMEVIHLGKQAGRGFTIGGGKEEVPNCSKAAEDDHLNNILSRDRLDR